MARSVDEYLARHPEWGDLLARLREILLGCGLDETVKWNAPVYTLDGRNVVGLGAFKSYAGLWFFDGALLEDSDRVLINAQEGKTRGLRQWRFEPGATIDPLQVRPYVLAAMDLVRQGRTVAARKRRPALPAPPGLLAALARDEALNKAFESLTPGRQREYIAYLLAPKREATRERRLEKILPMIARGDGLNDRYR